MPKKGFVKYPISVIDGVSGKVCNRCNSWVPISEFYFDSSTNDKLGRTCKICQSEYQSEWYIENRELVLEQSREWKINNPEKIKETNKIWINKNRDKVNGYTTKWRNNNKQYFIDWVTINAEKIKKERKEYYIENKEEINSKVIARRKENPLKFIEYHKKWCESNKDKIRIYKETRRSRKRNVLSTFTVTEWQWLKEICCFTCLCCGRMDKPLQCDHIIPLDPGTNTLENIQPLCVSCNSRKQRKTIDYRPDWLKKLVEDYINAATR